MPSSASHDECGTKGMLSDIHFSDSLALPVVAVAVTLVVALVVVVAVATATATTATATNPQRIGHNCRT